MSDLHLRVPRSLRENLLFRRKLLDETRSKVGRAAVRRACEDDCLFWINAFCWQYNPKAKARAEVGPFISYAFQDKAVRVIEEHIHAGRDLVIEKSRDMGLSWLNLLVATHLFLFKPWSKGLFLSRSAEAVDAHSPDSLFWKIDHILKYLPDWMRPHRMVRTDMYFGNEDTGATISGEASTGKAGVGGRSHYMFIDEFAQIREGDEVLRRTADTTDCRIFNSTHLGVGTAFYGLTTKGHMRKLRLHWSEHPKKNPGLYQFDRPKNRVMVVDTAYQFPPEFRFVEDGKLRSPWYDAECQRRNDPRAVAQDLDINPQGGLSQFFDPLQIATLVETWARDPDLVGDLGFDRESHAPKEVVAEPNGPLRLWLTLTGHGKPPPGKYAMGADLGAGLGATPSCITVGNMRTGEKVAEYVTATTRPDEMAAVARALGKFFADPDGIEARFAWEFAGPGVEFGKKIMEWGYGNAYFRKVESYKAKANGTSEAPGWYPTREHKEILLGEYRAALYARKFFNPSAYALKDALGYVYTGSAGIEHGNQANKADPSGSGVNHGDPVIADALCWKMIAESGLAATAKQAENRIVDPRSLMWRRQKAEAAKEDDGIYAWT